MENTELLTFCKNDVVILKDEFKTASNSYKKIIGKKLIVKSFKRVNLGDMIVRTLRFDTSTDGVENPYLAEHFKKV